MPTITNLLTQPCFDLSYPGMARPDNRSFFVNSFVVKFMNRRKQKVHENCSAIYLYASILIPLYRSCTRQVTRSMHPGEATTETCMCFDKGMVARMCRGHTIVVL